MRGLAEFKHELSKVSTLEAKLKAIFEGLIFNVFTLKHKDIERLNLATLELRKPEAYS